MSYVAGDRGAGCLSSPLKHAWLFSEGFVLSCVWCKAEDFFHSSSRETRVPTLFVEETAYSSSVCILSTLSACFLD